MLVIVILLIMAVFLFYGCYNQYFKITTYNITSDKTEQGFRIVFVSDLHLKEYGKDNIRLLNAIKKLDPDFIAVVGDSIINAIDNHESAISFLNNVSKIAPTYFSPGNHEWAEIYKYRDWNLYRNEDSTLYDDLQACGAMYLDNKISTITINDTEIVICGIFDTVHAKYKTTDDILEEFNSDKYSNSFKLLLNHCPMTISNTNVTPESDLVLSGHEHGGQIIIPFLNQGLYSRNQGLFPKHTSGINTIADNLVIISTGLSNSNQIIPRINNRPELVVIDVN